MSGRWGRHLLGLWSLDPARHHLNHGSYGATPHAVLAAQDQWRRRMETNPNGFFRREAPARVREAAGRVAAALGGAAEDWAFVENATAAVNAVLGSFPLRPGDEVVVSDQAYGAVRKALDWHCRRGGATVAVARLPWPATSDEAIVAALRGAVTGRTRLVLIDHVTSPTATIMPVAALCRALAPLPVLVDAAHAPGMLSLDVPSLGAAWWVGNLHKWAFTPKGCAVLWAAPAHQAGLCPPVISHGSGQGFTAAFDWQGTRDLSGWLAAPAALDFHEELGGADLRARNRALAWEAATALAAELGTEIGTPQAMTGGMAAIRLPDHLAGTDPVAVMRALADKGFEVPVMTIDGRNWLRVSAQAYNDAEEYQALAQALRGLG